MILHGYFRSSASYRVRIALNLKKLSWAFVLRTLHRVVLAFMAYFTASDKRLVGRLTRR